MSDPTGVSDAVHDPEFDEPEEDPSVAVHSVTDPTLKLTDPSGARVPIPDGFAATVAE